LSTNWFNCTQLVNMEGRHELITFDSYSDALNGIKSWNKKDKIVHDKVIDSSLIKKYV
jgi:hypothetical protein